MIISEARANVVRPARSEHPRGYVPGFSHQRLGENQSSSLKSLSRPPGTSLFRGAESFKSPRAAPRPLRDRERVTPLRSVPHNVHPMPERCASREDRGGFPVKPTHTRAHNSQNAFVRASPFARRRAMMLFCVTNARILGNASADPC